MLNPELLAILRCPKCRGVLKVTEKATKKATEPSADQAAAQDALQCPACRLSYAIQDGIPNLLIEEAQPLSA